MLCALDVLWEAISVCSRHGGLAHKGSGPAAEQNSEYNIEECALFQIYTISLSSVRASYENQDDQVMLCKKYSAGCRLNRVILTTTDKVSICLRLGHFRSSAKSLYFLSASRFSKFGATATTSAKDIYTHEHQSTFYDHRNTCPPPDTHPLHRIP